MDNKNMEQKSNKIGKNTRKSGAAWCEILGIRLLEITNSWNGVSDFSDRLLLYEDFLNMAASCKVEKLDKNVKMTRREAALARQDLMNKLN